MIRYGHFSWFFHIKITHGSWDSLPPSRPCSGFPQQAGMRQPWIDSGGVRGYWPALGLRTWRLLFAVGQICFWSFDQNMVFLGIITGLYSDYFLGLSWDWPIIYSIINLYIYILVVEPQILESVGTMKFPREKDNWWQPKHQPDMDYMGYII